MQDCILKTLTVPSKELSIKPFGRRVYVAATGLGEFRGQVSLNKKNIQSVYTHEYI